MSEIALEGEADQGGGGKVGADQGGAGQASATESRKGSRTQPSAEPHPLTGMAMVLGVGVLALSNFMAVLDTSIANVSVPNIAGGLAVSPNEGTWVITSYSVAEAITVPLTGWLAQRFGAVKVFISAIACFGICSALCGLAPSLGVLVMCRILQGLAGGPMMPLSQTLLMRIVPPNQRNQALGLWAMTTVVAPIAGPVLGGSISDNFGWPWVFYINVPVAILCVVVAISALRGQETPTRKLPVDFIGLGLLIVWVGAFQLMLDKGKELDWFASPLILGCLVTAIIGFFAFLIWELTDEHPIVDLRIFRYRGFSIGVCCLCLTFGVFFASVVIVPLWLQTNMGYTATWAGYATGFNGLLAVVFSPIVPKLMQKFDPRLLVSFGVLWLAGVMVARTTFTSAVDFQHIILPQIAQGLAMPFFFIPLMGLALGQLKPEEYASGAGLLNFMRTTSGAFAVSLTTTAWDDAATASRSDIVSNISGAGATMHQFAAPGMNPDQALRSLEGLVQSQAVMLATNRIFLVVAVFMVVSALSIWFAPKPAGPMRGGGGGH